MRYYNLVLVFWAKAPYNALAETALSPRLPNLLGNVVVDLLRSLSEPNLEEQKAEGVLS